MPFTGLSASTILLCIGLYFLLLILIAYYTGKKSDNASFFLAGRQAPWYLVAFGMIGASISGVTFISVPGFVKANQFSYFQVVIGYIFGYLTIGLLLMPMYYKLNLTSIYTYLEKRFGYWSYKSGSAFFILSRTIGSACRLYLVALVLYQFVFASFGVPFWLTTLITIFLIWVYTFRGGIKTIVYTDVFQTTFLLSSLFISVFFIARALDLNLGELWQEIQHSHYSKVFFIDSGWSDSNNFIKQFLGGMFITIVMTGLDQDLMQKNLSCPNIKDAQKNMFSFTIILVIANAFFLVLGALLFIYASQTGIEIPTREINGKLVEQTDLLFPLLALQHFGSIMGIVFILGLTAANYASADSALAALTTAFCIDFLGFEKGNIADHRMKPLRTWVHFGFSILLFLMVMVLWLINDRSIIDTVLRVAGYTYGPLLGLYAFGFFVRRQVQDKWVPLVCVLSPIITYILNANSVQWLWGYKFSFELLILNGCLTFLGLWLISHQKNIDPHLLGRR